MDNEPACSHWGTVRSRIAHDRKRFSLNSGLQADSASLPRAFAYPTSSSDRISPAPPTMALIFSNAAFRGKYLKPQSAATIRRSALTNGRPCRHLLYNLLVIDQPVQLGDRTLREKLGIVLRL